MTPEADRESRGRRVRPVLLVVVALVVTVLAVAAWIGVRGWLAKAELEAAAESAAAVSAAMTARDPETAALEVDRLVAHASEAASLTGDPIWAAAQAAPWIGDDLTAVGTMARELDRVSSEAVRPLATVLEDLDPNALREPGGRIDMARIDAAAPVVHLAAASIADARERVSGISPNGLLAPVAGARERFVEALAAASDLVSGLDATVRFVPAVLGADAPRQYLILSLNNAELRTAGGIPGAIALVRIDDGALSLVRQASAYDFSAFSPPLAVADGTRAVFGDEVGEFIQNVTMSPDFTETGRLAAGMWERTFGDRIDGVVALDPIALSYLLRATGPVTASGESPIDADNAVSRLLIEPYRDPTFDQFARDRYFSGIAAATLATMLSEPIDLGTMVESLSRAGAEHRISMWSADPDEQDALEQSPFAGLLAAQDAAGPQAYGVYLNDTTAAKLDPYLDVTIDVGASDTRADGRAEVTVRVALENTVTTADLALMPSDASGAYREGFGQGRIATIATAFAPRGAYDGGVRVDGLPVEYLSRDSDGRLASSLQVDVEPGETKILEFAFVTAEPGQVDPEAVHTPLIRALEVGRL